MLCGSIVSLYVALTISLLQKTMVISILYQIKSSKHQCIVNNQLYSKKNPGVWTCLSHLT